MSFWQNYGLAPSPINGLIEQGCSLEQVLDEADVFTEVKSKNKKLTDLYPFFCFVI